MNNNFAYENFPENSFDMLLVLAAKNAGTSEITEYNSFTESVDFSCRYTKRITGILFQKNKAYYERISIRRKLFIAIIIALLACAVVGGGVFAYKKLVAEIKLRQEEEFVSVEYDYKNSYTDYKSVNYCEPSYVPSKFQRVEIAKDSTGILIEYRYDRKIIYFQQDILTESYTLHTTNEETQIETVIINDRYDAMMAISYPANKKNVTIAWNDGKYAYVLGGNAEENILLKMAESIYE